MRTYRRDYFWGRGVFIPGLGTSPQHLLDSGELVNHHQRGQYPLIIDETAPLPPRIKDTIVFR